MLLAYGIERQVSISNFGRDSNNMESYLSTVFLIFIHHYHNHPTTRRSMILITICEFSQLQTENTERG